jgi:hypothetical protein
MDSAVRKRYKKAAPQVSVGIRKNIPFNKEEVVMRTEVARKVGNRVLTKSTKVVVPVAPSAPLNLPSPPPDHDAPPTPAEQARKGPSRSAAVCFSPYLTQQIDVYRNTDDAGTMASTQRRVRRRVHQTRSVTSGG